jgi:hypothetical protein
VIFLVFALIALSGCSPAGDGRARNAIKSASHERELDVCLQKSKAYVEYQRCADEVDARYRK